jgi:hypothetical protein
MRAVVLLAVLACSSKTGAPHDAAVHLDGLSCLASGGCANGPPCGNGCCAAGEACISGVCMCAQQAACGSGDVCASPVAMGNGCGDICCGATGPCPGVQ